MDILSKSLDPEVLYDEGWRVRMVEDRHELAHEYFLRSLELAWKQTKPAAASRALISLTNNLLWYCPEWIEQLNSSCAELDGEALTMAEYSGDANAIANALRAQDKCRESLQICLRINDRVGVVRSLARLAFLANYYPRDTLMSPLWDEALSLARELNQPDLLADVLSSAALFCRHDEARRRAMYQEAAEIYRKLGYRRNLHRTLMTCAALCDECELAMQERQWEEALATASDLSSSSESVCLKALAEIATQRGNAARAAELMARHDAIEACHT